LKNLPKRKADKSRIYISSIPENRRFFWEKGASWVKGYALIPEVINNMEAAKE